MTQRELLASARAYVTDPALLATIDAALSPKRAKPAEETVDLATLTDTALHAYYKRVSPLEDVRFWLRLSSLNGERPILERLEADAANGLSRPEVFRRLLPVQATWRARAEAKHRAARQRLARWRARADVRALAQMEAES